MKIRDFYDQLVRSITRYRGDDDRSLVVFLEEPSMGAKACTEVTGVYEGIDWDSGKLIVATEEKVVRDGYRRVYYAHPVNIYGKPQEEDDIRALTRMGFKVHNPNCEEDQEGYKRGGMEYFTNLVRTGGFSLLAFRAFPDGMIGAGVYKEIRAAKEAGIPVMELPGAISERALSVSATVRRVRGT